MSDFWHCVIYLGILGVAITPVGRWLAKLPLQANRFPFAPFAFEDEGRVYERLGINRWKKRVPDMSKLLTAVMPAKAITGRPNAEQVGVMLKENCVAELSHHILSILGIACLWIWRGVGGWVVWLLYVLLGNLPFIIIQRYNRPRLLKLRMTLLAREAKRGA